MLYDGESDSYLCSNQKKIIKTDTRKTKSKTGYISEKTCYTCENCIDCPLKTKCIKGNNSKLPLEERRKHGLSKISLSWETERFGRKYLAGTRAECK